MTHASSNRAHPEWCDCRNCTYDEWRRKFLGHTIPNRGAICTCCAAEGLVGWFTDPECPLHGKNAIPNRVHCYDSACSLPSGHAGPHFDKRDGKEWENYDNESTGRATRNSAATDVQALRALAEDFRRAEYEMRRDEGRCVDAPYRGHYPGLRITAIQLEWAAREIERLRDA